MRAASFPAVHPGLRSQPKIVGIAGENGAAELLRLAIAAFIWWIARTWGRTPMPQENAASTISRT